MNINKVIISQQAYDQWMQLAQSLASKGNLNPKNIPDEECDILPDGSLLIFVKGVKGAELIVPKEQWRFIN